jgi:hypothetical protein
VDVTALMVVISAVAAISGVVLGWTGKTRTVRQDTTQEVRENTTIKSDVEYIKRGVDDMRLEMRSQGQRFDVLAERVTRVEESAKQAHHRLDRLDVVSK